MTNQSRIKAQAEGVLFFDTSALLALGAALMTVHGDLWRRAVSASGQGSRYVSATQEEAQLVAEHFNIKPQGLSFASGVTPTTDLSFAAPYQPALIAEFPSTNEEINGAATAYWNQALKVDPQDPCGWLRKQPRLRYPLGEGLGKAISDHCRSGATSAPIQMSQTGNQAEAAISQPAFSLPMYLSAPFDAAFDSSDYIVQSTWNMAQRISPDDPCAYLMRRATELFNDVETFDQGNAAKWVESITRKGLGTDYVSDEMRAIEELMKKHCPSRWNKFVKWMLGETDTKPAPRPVKDAPKDATMPF